MRNVQNLYWSYIKRTISLIVKILKKDPLDDLKESEIT